MFKGSITALVTPFTPSLEVDVQAFRDLVEWHIEEGSDALVVSGTTGEAPTLSFEEQIELTKIAVQTAKGRIPIIAGTGTCDTKKSLLLTKAAKDAGANACLITVPYYNKPTFEGCRAHFLELAKVAIPLILYHHPGRTGVRLQPRQIAEICQIPQVAAIKECSGDVEFALQVMRYTSKPLLSGDDALTLPLMAVGATGVISVIANLIPGPWKHMIEAATAGNRSVAKAYLDRYFPLCKALTLETNPQGVKYALSLLGKCTPTFRLPLLEPQESTKKEIRQAFAQAGTLFTEKVLAL